MANKLLLLILALGLGLMLLQVQPFTLAETGDLGEGSDGEGNDGGEGNGGGGEGNGGGGGGGNGGDDSSKKDDSKKPKERFCQKDIRNTCTIAQSKETTHVVGGQQCLNEAERAFQNLQGATLAGQSTVTTTSDEKQCRALCGNPGVTLQDGDDEAIANCCEAQVCVLSTPGNALYGFFSSAAETIASNSMIAIGVPLLKKFLELSSEDLLKELCQPIKNGGEQTADANTCELLKAFKLQSTSRNFQQKIKEQYPDLQCTVVYLDSRVPSKVVDQFSTTLPELSPHIQSVAMQANSKGARYVFQVYHFSTITDIEVCTLVKTCVKPHVTPKFLQDSTKCVQFMNRGYSQARDGSSAQQQQPQQHLICGYLEGHQMLTITGPSVRTVRIDLSPLPPSQRERIWFVLASRQDTYATTRDLNNVYLLVPDGQNPMEYFTSWMNNLLEEQKEKRPTSKRIYVGVKDGKVTVSGSREAIEEAKLSLGASAKSETSSSMVIGGLKFTEVFQRLSNTPGIQPYNGIPCEGAKCDEFLKKHGSTLCLPCNAYHLGTPCPKSTAVPIIEGAKVKDTSGAFKAFYLGRGKRGREVLPDPKTGGSTARSFALDAAVLGEYFAGQETPGDQVDMTWMINGARAIINIGEHQRRNRRYLFVEDALVLNREQLGNYVQANPQMDTIVTFQTIGLNGELERQGHHVLVALRINRETHRVDHVTIYDDTHIANRQTFQDIARNIRNNLDVPVGDDAITFERFDGLNRVLNVGDTCGLHVLEMFFRLLYNIPLRGGTYFFNDVRMYNLNAIADRTVEYFRQQPTQNAGAKAAAFSEAAGKDGGFSITPPPRQSSAKVPGDSAASDTFAPPPNVRTPVAKDPDGSPTDGPVGPIVSNVDNALAFTVGGSDTGAGKESGDSAADGAVISTVDGGIVSMVDGPGVSTPHGNTGKMNTVSTTAGSASNDNILADTARDSTTNQPPQPRLVADLTTPQGLEDCIGEYCDRRTLTTAPRDGFICDNTQCKKQRKHKSDELPVFSSDGSIPWARCCCGHESYCSIKCARKNPHSVCNLFTTPSPCSSCAKEFKHSELHRCICGSGPFCKACLIEFKKNHECGVAQHTPDPDHAHQNEVIEHMQRNCPQAKTMYCSPTSARNLIIQRLGQKKGSSFFTVLHITPAGLVAASASTGTRPVLVEILFSSKKPLSIDIHIPCLHPGTNHPEAEIKTDRLLQNVRDWLQTLGTPENALPTPETTEYFKTPAMFSSRPGLRLGVVQSLLRDILRLLRGKDLPVKNQNAFKTAVPLDNTFAPFDLTALTALLALLNNASTSTPVSRTKRGRETTESDSESEKSDSSDSEEEDDSSDSDDSDDSE